MFAITSIQVISCLQLLRNVYKTAILKKFRIFKGKYLCRGLFYAGLQASNCVEKETSTQIFSREYREIYKNTYFQEHLRTTASEPRQDSSRTSRSEIDGSSCFKTIIFSHFEKECIGSIRFNEKIINMILPTKVRNNFHTQVFNTFSRMQSLAK